MARNPVQFQKGISLNEFLSLYGTEQQCFDALYHWRWPNGFVCPNCGHDRGCQLTTHKLEQCYRCNRQTSITAGTIFEATKLPLTVWFQGIYFMTQDKKGASAMKLHRQLGISYNAAWRMRHKLMQVMMERDRAHPLGGFIQLDDAYLGGERSGGKRGRGAPGKTPFVAAVETNAALQWMQKPYSRHPFYGHHHLQVCPALSRGVRVPVQSALRPARHHPQTGLRGAANPADAGAAAQVTLGLSGNQVHI